MNRRIGNSNEGRGCPGVVLLVGLVIAGCAGSAEDEGGFAQDAHDDRHSSPSMAVSSPTPGQAFDDCQNAQFDVCVPVVVVLQHVDLVANCGQPNVEGEGHLFVTVGPAGNPGNPITSSDAGIIDTNFTIDISPLQDGVYTLRVELRNNDRTLYSGLSPVTVDFSKGAQ